MHANGTIQNVIVQLGTSAVMMSEAAGKYKSVAAAYYLYVEDAQASMRRAIECGAQLEMEVADMLYGDRQGGGRDAHGNIGWISQRIVREPYSP